MPNLAPKGVEKSDVQGCNQYSTYHPTYEVDGVVHYCVANMPGAVPRTSTLALTNATLPYVLKIANLGSTQAMLEDEHLLKGLNVHQGMITNKAVAENLGYGFVDPADALIRRDIRIAS